MPADAAVDRTPAGTTTRGAGWSAFRMGWLAILVVTVTANAWTLSSWSWLQDDLLLTSEVPRQGFAHFVFQDVAGHVFPGELLMSWVFTTLDPLDYTWPALSICLFAGAVVVGWGLAFREIFGERLHLLIPLVVLTLSPGATLVDHWWISAINVLPMQASMGFCVWFLARYLLRGRRRADLVWMNVSYALGLLMWEKSLLITVPLLFVCLLLGPGRVRDGFVLAVRTLWPTALVTLAYVAFYLWAIHDAPAGKPPVEYARTLGSAATLVASGTVNSVLPSLVGGPFRMPGTSLGTFPSSSGALALVLWGVTVVLVIVAISFRRRGVVALGMSAAYALISWGLVFFSDRFPAVGTILLGAARYSADVLPVVLLTCMFLVTRTVGEAQPLRRPVPAPALAWIGRGLVVYLVAVSLLCAVNSGRAWDAIEPSSTKPFMDSLVKDARALGRADVYDTRVPDRIVNPVLLEGGSHVSDVLGPLDLPLRFNRPTARYAVLDGDGHFRDAAVVGGQTNVAPGPDGPCGYAVNKGRPTRIPLNGSLFELQWAVEITYFTGSDATVSVRTDDDRVDVEVPRNKAGELGKRQFIVSGPVSALSVEQLSGNDSVCVTDVRVGIIQATDKSPARLENK
jgi:hypothetical protein